jgi:cell division protein FtsL
MSLKVLLCFVSMYNALYEIKIKIQEIYQKCSSYKKIDTQGDSNMTGTDLCVN